MNEITSIEDIQELVRSGFTDWGRYGYVTVREKDGLLIFNYNTMAQYEGRWNYFERVSRGLIIDHRTGEIVARPFDKFFNWGQDGLFSTAPIRAIYEKIDGSLGILYRKQGSYHISTRGHYESPQAVWATQYLNDKYDLTGLADNLTLLFEIIYPENRVIVDYGEREDLVLLAARDRHTGEYVSFDDVDKLATQYGFTRPKSYQITDVETLIKQTQTLDTNDEGYVVEFDDGQRFKFKGERYLQLHKSLVTLTFKNVRKAMQNGEIETMLAIIPDEFLTEAKQWIIEIEAMVAQVKSEVQAVFEQAPKRSRKEFAMWVMQNHKPLSSYLFAMMDGKDIEPLIYQHHNWEINEED